LTDEALILGDNVIGLLNGFIKQGLDFRVHRGIGDRFLPLIQGRKIQLTDLQQKVLINQALPHTEYLANEFDIILESEARSPFSPLGISSDSFEFAAKVLLNILVPDFESEASDIPPNDNTDLENDVHRKRQKKALPNGGNNYKKVIIHMGPDKTGSSSIQSALDKNRTALLGNGVFYPSGRKHSQLGSCLSPDPQQFIFNRLRNRDKTLAEIQAGDEEYFKLFIDALDNTQADTLILSAEGFVYLTETALDNMKEMLERYCEEFEIVLYIRAPLSFAASAISQRIKSGERVMEHMMPPIVPYQDFIEKISRVFGKEQINLRVSSKETFAQGNVVLDFLSLLNVPQILKEQITTSESKKNSSLTEEGVKIGDKMIELLDGFVAFGADFQEKRGLGNKILPMIRGRKLQLTDLQRENVLKQSTPHTTFLEREFGILIKEENIAPYSPLNVTDESIDFTAKLLLNLFVPDFKMPVTRSQADINNELESNSFLQKKKIQEIFRSCHFLLLMKLKQLLAPYPNLRLHIKSLLAFLRLRR